MTQSSFTYHFTSAKTPQEIFALLVEVPQWWSGLFSEIIEGKTEKLEDEFSFTAGGGAHYSVQKLVELIPNKKIVWEVIDSQLSFIKQTGEWIGSKIAFVIGREDGVTNIQFTHEGLTPALECYESCSSAWTQYLQKLEKKLNNPVAV